MNSEHEKSPESFAEDSLGKLRPGGLHPRTPAAGSMTAAAAPTRSLREGDSVAARMERERRRAVRAESRLAEVELALRRAIGASGGGGIPVGELRAVLDSVDTRLAALEDELKASESELALLEEAQRINRFPSAMGGDDVRRVLEETRRDLDDAMRADRAGPPELARQRMEFEVELDRLQSLLGDRQNVCEGLAEELQSGTRVTAEIINRLADLSRGRVASTRRPPTTDARIAALRRDLENEQAQLQQTRRALEAARAKAKSAQLATLEAEKDASDRLDAMARERLEREREHARLYADLEQKMAAVRDAEAEARRKLQDGLAERHALQMRLEAVNEENARLREQIALAASEREHELLQRLAESESRLEQTESERVRLAERVSLLQAAQAAKEAAEKRRESAKPVVDLRPKRRVLSLVHNRPPTAAGEATAGEDGSDGQAPEAQASETLREREREIERLSKRWRELQDAYKDALSEFEDMRGKRDSLLLRLNQPPGAPPANAPGESTSPPVAADVGEVPAEEHAPPSAYVVHVDRDRGRAAALAAVLREREGIEYVGGGDPEVPRHVEVWPVVNLIAEDCDPLARVAALAGGARAVASFSYCARGERGFAVGPLEYFPAPFDAEVCALRLLGRSRPARRVLAVGEAIESLSMLRETLGRGRCSTAVAFDGNQALELAPLVRPDYVLVDLSLPAGDALRIVRVLRRGPRGGEMAFGAMWSRPVEADKLRRDLRELVGAETLSASDLAAAVARWLAATADPSRD